MLQKFRGFILQQNCKRLCFVFSVSFQQPRLKRKSVRAGSVRCKIPLLRVQPLGPCRCRCSVSDFRPPLLQVKV